MTQPISRRRLFRAGLAGAAALGAFAALPRPSLAQAVQAAQLSDADMADIKRIEDYLNGLTTVQASFHQEIAGEGDAFGRIYLNRPGRLRVEYDPPSEILLIADGTLLSYYDKELNHLEQVPLNLSPMWFLLRDDVELGGDVTVTRFQKATNVIQVGLVQTDEPDAGSVVLEFGDKPLELRRWALTDPAGTEVHVALNNAEFGVQLPNALFATPRKTDRDRR